MAVFLLYCLTAETLVVTAKSKSNIFLLTPLYVAQRVVDLAPCNVAHSLAIPCYAYNTKIRVIFAKISFICNHIQK
jgi:hypothetical protein